MADWLVLWHLPPWCLSLWCLSFWQLRAYGCASGSLVARNLVTGTKTGSPRSRDTSVVLLVPDIGCQPLVKELTSHCNTSCFG